MARTSKDKRVDGSNFRDFDWNKVKLFYHIAKCGSFMKAAQVADTDQPTLTRQMQVLERQVGYPLLLRKQGSAKITLTRKGGELFSRVAPLFLEMKGFCGNHYVEIGEEKKRRIRISTSHALAAYVITDLIIDYNKDNPHLFFEIIGNDDVIDVILNDVDIIIQPYDPNAKGVQQELLFTLQKKLYTSDEYIQKYGEPKTVEDLKSHRLIAISSTPENYPHADIHWILKLGMPEGKKLEPVFLSNSIEGRVDAAKKGIGIISSYGIMSIIRNSKLKNILPDVCDKTSEECFTYPDYLKEDQEIIKLKNYLHKRLNSIKT